MSDIDYDELAAAGDDARKREREDAMFPPSDNDKFALEAFAVASRIKPLLAGKHPAVQGAALAELLSLWLAGHSAEVREQLLLNHIETVRKLVPHNAAIIRGESE